MSNTFFRMRDGNVLGWFNVSLKPDMKSDPVNYGFFCLFGFFIPPHCPLFPFPISLHLSFPFGPVLHLQIPTKEDMAVNTRRWQEWALLSNSSIQSCVQVKKFQNETMFSNEQWFICVGRVEPSRGRIHPDMESCDSETSRRNYYKVVA